MMTKCWIFATIFVAIWCGVLGQRQAQCCEEYCYDLDTERPQSAHFGTKTAYQIIKGSPTGNQHYVPNCTPVKVWLLSRHGTKLPNAKHMQRLKALEYLRDEIMKNYDERRSKPDVGSLCEGDLETLRAWKWDRNITEEFDEFLHVQGWNDLKFLAIHYQRVYPNLFETTYDQLKFQFRHTATQRTEASFKAFVEGLFGENAYRYVKPLPIPRNDSLLRPYDFCPTWDKDSAKGKSSERLKFDKSQVVTQLINDVSMRLGFKYPMKMDQIGDIYDMCRYDQSWKLDAASPWCIAFTPNQVNIMEFREDLKYYFSASYGRTVNSNLMCEAVADMLTHLESRDLPRVVAYFTHASAILQFLTALGAARDNDAPTADNYYSMMRRNWRTSRLSPFASNIAAIKYECPEDVDREKIMFFLNETPLDFPWCKVGLCSWKDVKEKYKRYARGDCATTFCNDSNTHTVHSMLIYVMTPLIALIAFRQWH